MRCKPWNCVEKGETIYFKNSSEPVRMRAEVKKVMQFSDLTPKRVKEILNKYGDDDGLEKEKIPEFFEKFKSKKYCMLIFLENPQEIKPFQIDKTGFGTMSAWIVVDDISKIRR